MDHTETGSGRRGMAREVVVASDCTCDHEESDGRNDVLACAVHGIEARTASDRALVLEERAANSPHAGPWSSAVLRLLEREDVAVGDTAELGFVWLGTDASAGMAGAQLALAASDLVGHHKEWTLAGPSVRTRERPRGLVGTWIYILMQRVADPPAAESGSSSIAQGSLWVSRDVVLPQGTPRQVRAWCREADAPILMMVTSIEDGNVRYTASSDNYLGTAVYGSKVVDFVRRYRPLHDAG